MSKRKNCPVKQRLIIELYDFDKTKKSTFDGTETVRCLNKFDRKWFRENAIAIVQVSKSFYGRTFVIPYVDIDETRYWLVDNLKKRKEF